MKKLSKKQATLIALTLVLGLGLFGCGKGPGGDNNTNQNQNVNQNQNANLNQDIANKEPTILTPPSNPINTSDWTTYRNNKYGYEIKFPKNFINSSEYDGSILPIREDAQGLNLVGGNPAKKGIVIYIYDGVASNHFRKIKQEYISKGEWQELIVNNNIIITDLGHTISEFYRGFVIQNKDYYINMQIFSLDNDLDAFVYAVLSSLKLF